MKTLYANNDILAKLKGHLLPFFDGFTKPTARTLIWMVIAMLVLGGVQSVRNLHTDFLADLDLVSLNTLYHALSYAKRPLKRAFDRVIARMLFRAVPTHLRGCPVFLCVDDTLVPKFGRKFDWVGTLFDHAAHDGKPYKNAHCFVCIALAVPAGTDPKTGTPRYLSVPLRLCLWKKGGPSKLQIAHDILLDLRSSLQELGNYVLLADSWYPKKDLLRILDEWAGLQFIGAVRSDSEIYDLPPKRTGKRGRPRKYGQRLRPSDFTLRSSGLKGYDAGCRPVLASIFGYRQVTAFVTCPSEGGARRLYLSTMTCHDVKRLAGSAIQYCEQEHEQFIPLFLYRQRWTIEVIFLELKVYWSLESYMVRNEDAIDLLLNLIVVAYSLTKLLPYVDTDFHEWQELSTQQTRLRLGKLISRRIFLWHLSQELQSGENPCGFEKSFTSVLRKFANLS